LEEPTRACNDAVATPRRETTRENFEHARSIARPVGERSFEHRQFVLVREQRGADSRGTRSGFEHPPTVERGPLPWVFRRALSSYPGTMAPCSTITPLDVQAMAGQ